MSTTSEPSPRCRVAIAGTGDRGTSMWARELLREQGELVELVGLHDINPLRLDAARTMLGSSYPAFTDLGEMLRTVRPEKLIVCTRDDTHDRVIVAALQAGVGVISEKPLTTSVQGCHAILEAEQRSAARVDLAFNYRCAPTAARIKSLLMEGAIGTVTSVDFHWYLDTRHGADYFRRWHSTARHSGSLFVHKATHHFDLLAWYLGSAPAEVFAKADRRRYGDAGPFRGETCRNCAHTAECPFYVDIGAQARMRQLYVVPEAADGYARDACVFRKEIDIPDTMAGLISFENQVMVSYSLAAYLPVEGYSIAFNGLGGRLELRQYEKQPWDEPDHDEIRLTRAFGGTEIITVAHQDGGHYGGDRRLRELLFKPELPDPLHQRAGLRDGILSVMTGIAALESARQGRAVKIKDLWARMQA